MALWFVLTNRIKSDVDFKFGQIHLEGYSRKGTSTLKTKIQIVLVNFWIWNSYLNDFNYIIKLILK